MKVTNNEGLPSGFLQCVSREYEKEEEEGVYSATEVLKGVTEILLERRHGEVSSLYRHRSRMIFKGYRTKVGRPHRQVHPDMSVSLPGGLLRLRAQRAPRCTCADVNAA